MTFSYVHAVEKYKDSFHLKGTKQERHFRLKNIGPYYDFRYQVIYTG